MCRGESFGASCIIMELLGWKTRLACPQMMNLKMLHFKSIGLKSFMNFIVSSLILLDFKKNKAEQAVQSYAAGSRGVPRVRLGGQTTTNVLVSALVSDCTNVLAKCRSILPKVLLLKSS